MLYKGHMAAGAIMSASAAASICIISNEPISKGIGITLAACASSFITSTIPDLDSSTSRISRKIPVMPFIKLFLVFFILSKTALFMQHWNNRYHSINIMIHVAFAVFLFSSLGHRKIMHSIWIAGASYFVSNRYIGFDGIIPLGISIGIIMGILSHLWGDMHTTDGCMLLYPVPIVFKVSNNKSGKDDKKILFKIIIECIIIILSLFTYKYFYEIILFINQHLNKYR